MKKLFTLLFLFLATTVYCSDIPDLITYPPQKIMGFRGLDTKSKAPNIADGRSPDLLNVVLTSSLDLMKRHGYDTVNDTTLDDFDLSGAAITGIFDSEYSNGNSWTLAFVGNKIKYDNSGTWDTVGNWWEEPTVTSGKNNQWLCDMALDNAICNNGVDLPTKINSTPSKAILDVSDLTDALTTTKAQIWFRNYLIFGNNTEGATARPTRFRWSNVGTIETWSDDDFVDIASLNGDELISFKELYGELYIIMRKSIWKASLVGGNDVFVFIKMIDGIGSIAKGSVQVVTFPGNKLGVIFVSEDKKIYLFNGITVVDIGNIIQPTLDGLSASRLEYASSIFDGENYYLSITTGTGSTNDTVYIYNTEIQEWTRYTQIDANAWARVKESTSLIKTYFGNYQSLVYWLDNSDLINDVTGFTGIVDSTSVITSATETGVTILIDADVDSDSTGVIVRITSGTGAGQESVVIDTADTYLVVSPTFSTSLDTTSNYSLGDINAYYETKWYDFGDAARDKTFIGTFFWASEASNSEVIFSYSRDFGSTVGSEIVDLSPSSGSLWDSAIWNEATWGTTGDKFYNTKMSSNGKVIQIKFDQPNIDKRFNIYGYHLLGQALDVNP